jgi:hypothetical protein
MRSQEYRSQDTPGGSGWFSNNGTEGPCALTPTRTAGQSVGAPNVNSLPLNNMWRILTAVQQFMAEFNGAMSEEEKTVCET